jgi:signal transduction histidine kinase
MAQILIVEDELIVARDLEASLSRLGHDVVGVAASSEEALEAVKQRRPDLVLMDIRLKGPLDGVSTAEKLRALFDLPVIYLTAYADDATVERAKHTLPMGYLLKPYNTKELRSTVEIALYKDKLERKLQESERWFSTTLNALGDAVLAVTPDGRVSFMNPAAERLLKVRSAQAQGKPIDEVMPLVKAAGRSPVPSPALAALSLGQLVHLPSGCELDGRAIEDSAAPIITPDGRTLGAVVVFRDATEQHQLQRKVAEAERLSALGTLVSGVAHEIRNPLSVVVLNTELLLRAFSGASSDEALKPAEAAELLHEVFDGAKRINRIVSDLNTASRAPDQPLVPIDLSGVIGWVKRATAPQLEPVARLIEQLAPVPLVLADDSRLGQVLVNLVLNAVQAFATPGLPTNEIIVSTAIAEGRVVISVADNAGGIPPEVLSRIFEPFFTTKPLGKGTGLGLAISRGIVASFGGELTVATSLGKGTTFSVKLPPAPSEPATTAQLPAALTAARRARILLIDDEPALIRAMTRVLVPTHEVVSSVDARAAVQLALGSPPFDLILCDVMLPGFGGVDFYRAVLAQAPRVAERIVFISGGVFSGPSVPFLASIPNTQLIKPVSPSVLKDFVQLFLARYAAARN